MEILFATDFSEASTEAARTAAAYAHRFGARLHVLHVTWPGSDPVKPPLLGKLAEELGAAVPVVTAVESGNPAAQIVRYAERKGTDLIVLGTHGRTGVTRALIGSVAERVIRTAPCPVLTVPVRPPSRVAEAAPEPPAARAQCLVCALPSEDLICAACRERIRGEALERKHREERAGRT
jgi:nucleotide-binding universal stress UspA family protein